MKVEKERKLREILQTLFREGVYTIDNGYESREIGQLFSQIGERNSVLVSYDQKRQKSVLVDDGLDFEHVFSENYFHVTELEDVLGGEIDEKD